MSNFGEKVFMPPIDGEMSVWVTLRFLTTRPGSLTQGISKNIDGNHDMAMLITLVYQFKPIVSIVQVFIISKTMLITTVATLINIIASCNPSVVNRKEYIITFPPDLYQNSANIQNNGVNLYF